MEQKELAVNPRNYYRSLGKKEKTQFINYLQHTYDMKYATIRRKLSNTPNSELNKLEKLAIINAIETEAWKQ